MRPASIVAVTAILLASASWALSDVPGVHTIPDVVVGPESFPCIACEPFEADAPAIIIKVHLTPAAGWWIISADAREEYGRAVWYNGNGDPTRFVADGFTTPSYLDVTQRGFAVRFHGLLAPLQGGPGPGPGGGLPPEFNVALGDVDLDCDSDNDSDLPYRASQEKDEEDACEFQDSANQSASQPPSQPVGMQITPEEGWVKLCLKADPKKDGILSLQVSSTSGGFVLAKSSGEDFAALEELTDPQSPAFENGIVLDEFNVQKGGANNHPITSYYILATGTSGNVTVQGVLAPSDLDNYPPGNPPMAVDRIQVTAVAEGLDTNRDDLVDVGEDLLTFGRDTGTMGWQLERDKPQVYIPIAASQWDPLVVNAYLAQGAMSSRNKYWLKSSGTTDNPLRNPKGLWQAYSLHTRAIFLWEGNVPGDTSNPPQKAQWVRVVRPRGNAVTFQFDYDEDAEAYKKLGYPIGRNARRTYVLHNTATAPGGHGPYELHFESGIIHKFGGAGGLISDVSHADGRTVSVASMTGITLNVDATAAPGQPLEKEIATSLRYKVKMTWDATTKLISKVEYMDRAYPDGSKKITLTLDAASYTDDEIVTLGKSIDEHSAKYADGNIELGKAGETIRLSREADEGPTTVTLTTTIPVASNNTVTNTYILNSSMLVTSQATSAQGVSGTATTTYEYWYPDSTERYADNGSPKWSKVKKISRPLDGWWEYFTYLDAENYRTGWVHKHVTPYLAFVPADVSTEAAVNGATDGAHQEFAYAGTNLAPAGTTLLRERPRIVTLALSGTQASKTYYNYDGEVTTCQRVTERDAAWNADGNLTTTITRNPRCPDSVIGPAGGAAYSASYVAETNKLSVTADRKGPNNNLVTTRDTALNAFGYAETVTEHDGASLTYSVTTSAHSDGFGRTQRTSYLGGLSTEASTYTPWGPGTVTNIDGSKTVIEYDKLGRTGTVTRYPDGNTGSTRKAVSTFTWDVLGNATQVAEQGYKADGLGAGPFYTKAVYDILGRVTYLQNPEDKVRNDQSTGIAYIVANGMLQATVTYPDGKTQIVTSYPDGRTASVGGTGVYGVTYTHAVSASNTREAENVTATRTGTSEWTQTFYGLAGQPRRVGHSGTAHVAEITYDSKGRPEKYKGLDGIEVVGAYNARNMIASTTVGERVTEYGYSVGNDGHEFTTTLRSQQSGDTVVKRTFAVSGLGSKLFVNNRLEVNSSITAPSGGSWNATSQYLDGTKTIATVAGGDLTQVKDTLADESALVTVPVTQDALWRTKESSYRGEVTKNEVINNVGQVDKVTVDPDGDSRTWEVASRHAMLMPTGISRPDNKGTVTQNFGDKLEWKGASGPGVIDHQLATETNRPLYTDLDVSGHPAGNEPTRWSYDPATALPLTKLIAGDAVAALAYDSNLKALSLTQPDNVATFDYFASDSQVSRGLLKSITNTHDKRFDYEYTDQGEVKKIAVADEGELSLTYNADGQVAQEDSALCGSSTLSRTVRFQYDTSGRLERIQLMNGGTAAFTHVYGYDGSTGRSSGVAASGTYSWTYEPNSHLPKDLTYPGGKLVQSRTYKSGLNLLAEQATRTDTGVPLHRQAFAYNKMNQRTVLDTSSRCAGLGLAASSSVSCVYDSGTALTPSGTVSGALYIPPSDIDAAYAALGTSNATYDYDGSGTVTQADIDILVHNLVGTEYGDANLDGIVDQADYTIWYNHYGLPDPGWSGGDWNGDGWADQADYTLWYNHYGAVVKSRLTAAAVSSTRIDVAWQYLGRFGQAAVVLERTDDPGSGTWSAVATLAAGTWVYSDLVNAEERYCYRITVGGTVESNVMGVTTPRGVVLPQTPKDHLSQRAALRAGRLLPGQEFWYEYDGAGNRTAGLEQSGLVRTATSNTMNQVMTFDTDGRLRLGGHAGASDRVTVSVGGVEYPALRDESDWFASVAVSDPAADATLRVYGTNGHVLREETVRRVVREPQEAWHYDGCGNKIDDSRYEFTWNSRGRLTAVQTVNDSFPDATKRVRVEYRYDPLGRRTHKKVLDWDAGAGDYVTVRSDIRFVWAGWLCIAETDADGTLLRSFTWGRDLGATGVSPVGAAGVGGLVEVRDHVNDKVYWPISDAQGNVVGVVDPTGDNGGPLLVQSFEYGPFGELTSVDAEAGVPGWSAPASICPFLFSTKYFDAEVGLYYYGYRYYEPAAGKWLNRDPIAEAGGLNLYGFCNNDPVNGIDPLGEDFLSDFCDFVKMEAKEAQNGAERCAHMGKQAGFALSNMAVGAGKLATQIGDSVYFSGKRFVVESYNHSNLGDSANPLNIFVVASLEKSKRPWSRIWQDPIDEWEEMSVRAKTLPPGQFYQLTGQIGLKTVMVMSPSFLGKSGPALGTTEELLKFSKGTSALNQGIMAASEAEADLGTAGELLKFSKGLNQRVMAPMRGAVGEGAAVTRNWGGQSGPWGQSWTTDSIVTQSRNSLGLETTNTGQFVSHGTVINNNGIFTKVADPWGRFAGGGQETIIPSAFNKVRLDAVTMPDTPLPWRLPTDPRPLP